MIRKQRRLHKSLKCILISSKKDPISYFSDLEKEHFVYDNGKHVLERHSRSNIIVLFYRLLVYTGYDLVF